MAIDKIQSESINLADTFAFTGTVTGAGGITGAHHWRITTGISNMDNGDDVTSNWEQADSYGYGGIGSVMSESSGVFTFPETGIWRIVFIANGSDATDQLYCGGRITTTTDNSSYNVVNQANVNLQNNGSSALYFTTYSTYIFDVTSTSTHKVRFQVHCQNNGIALSGNTDRSDTCATFIRLGDT